MHFDRVTAAELPGKGVHFSERVERSGERLAVLDAEKGGERSAWSVVSIGGACVINIINRLFPEIGRELSAVVVCVVCKRGKMGL